MATTDGGDKRSVRASEKPPTTADELLVSTLVSDLGQMIESARRQVAVAANAGLTTLYWQLGCRVLTEVLRGRRAEYGAQIVAAVGRQLEARHGRGFGEKTTSICFSSIGICGRLVAIKLKIGDFKPADSGQMELYLRWLDRHERQHGEAPPLGIILCAGEKRETVVRSTCRVLEWKTKRRAVAASLSRPLWECNS